MTRIYNDNHSLQVSPPAPLLDWLLTPGSLTARAAVLCNTVQVQILCHKVTTAGLFREIYMQCDNTPWWYARTIMPYATYQLRQQCFDNLGTQPLANILYQDPLIIRKTLVLECLDVSHPEYQLAMQQLKHQQQTTSCLWARRSVFIIENSPLYLLEVLLPSLLEHLLC